jgi:FdhE protein
MMNRIPWDARIRRAELLAERYPATAEILRFYAQVARFQKSIYERNGSGPPEIDLPDLFCLIQRIGPPPLAEKARLLTRDPFFDRVLLQPYAERRANGLAPQGAAARCPVCNEWPQASALRGEGDGGKRWLVCSLCCGEWEFRRVLCPACGEEDKDQLPVFLNDSFEHARVEACDRCRSYIKSIDLTKDGLAVPVVDDLATVSLDLWAQEAGYHKLQPNILGL